MSNFCKTCKYVRTAEELGVVSPVTKAGELFCGNHPPQVGSQSVKNTLPTTHGFVEKWDEYTDQPIRLPPVNDGQGYRNMGCWSAPDRSRLATLHFSLGEIEALYTLMTTASIEWKLGHPDLYLRCQKAFVELRNIP